MASIAFLRPIICLKLSTLITELNNYKNRFVERLEMIREAKKLPEALMEKERKNLTSVIDELSAIHNDLVKVYQQVCKNDSIASLQKAKGICDKLYLHIITSNRRIPRPIIPKFYEVYTLIKKIE
ncbi:MAG: hypothetical protein ABWW69_04485 [Pyrodictiaceae archaeon]